jgi:signal transduction histidine kinase
MAKNFEAIEPDRGVGSGGWVRYQPVAADPSVADQQWLGILGFRAFRMLLWTGLVAVAGLILSNLFILGILPIADVATMAILAGALWLLSHKPHLLKALSWVVLLALFLDTLDGLTPLQQEHIRATLMLLPVLVLYGALLCDVALTIAALIFVLAICAFTWFHYAPLPVKEMMMLFNIMLAAVISAVASFGIWGHHRRLMGELGRQTELLRGELEANKRLNSIISHDIANPLSIALGTLDIAKMSGNITMDKVSLIDKMAEKIGSIIKTVRLVNANRFEEMPRKILSTDQMFEELGEVFSKQLAEKKQTFSMGPGAGLQVETIPTVFLDSVLGNLLKNAIKFSPKGGNIQFSAYREGGDIRIEMRDQGAGFPSELIFSGAKRTWVSSPGTEGESGTGLGLDIVAFFMSKLGGALEIKNREDGGASASVVLPMGRG